ncbi:hypothetical protein [Cellulomonas sp. HD19AZ1]|uniref:hypothetical protein n=1 Tax=Cellulomonas sp. HD19AZ1 TaxID=2559593 RepID=UPI00143108BB|nr:hypothetical protein [Cellulomonas sp. HD19AZ1]
MEDSVAAALADLKAAVSMAAGRGRGGQVPVDVDVEQIRASVVRAAHLGAPADTIATEGHLSVNWVREVIGAPAEPLHDRSGNAIWVFWPHGQVSDA